MTRRNILFGAAVLACAAAFADGATPAIENVVIRQRWPWSGVVDIDFTVRGASTGVKFLARCEGMEEFQLAEKDLVGDFDAVFEPGEHTIAWNPASAGFGDTELKGFSVRVLPEDRTYLILNLYDGSYRYAAAPPAGGWLSDPANYSTNIVFRRIPAGTKTLGLPADLKAIVNVTAAYANPHTATLTSDFYMSVYMITEGQDQYAAARGRGEYPTKYGTDRTRVLIPYNDIRGSKGDGIDWPSTEYAVAAGSRIAAYRTITASTFPTDWIIDMPTAVQWEYAARATTPDDQLYSTGGKATDSMETITNCLNQIAVWYGTSGKNGITQKAIGQMLPNGWGLYDMIGLHFVWNLDWYGNSGHTGTNPVGPTTGTARTRRSMYTSAPSGGSGFSNLNTAAMGNRNPDAADPDSYGYRLCIHLKSLFK